MQVDFKHFLNDYIVITSIKVIIGYYWRVNHNGKARVENFEFRYSYFYNLEYQCKVK